MDIKTKYDIDDKVFFVEVWENRARVRYEAIRSINIGGKAWEKYELGNTSRAEHDLYTEFADAKKAAIERQKDLNKKSMELVKELTPPFRL